MPSLGPFELAIIALIVVLLFGVGKLSDVGGAVGKSIREFRKAVKDENATEETESLTAATETPADDKA